MGGFCARPEEYRRCDAAAAQVFSRRFERAEQEPDEDERQRLMTFVVVGGGADRRRDRRRHRRAGKLRAGTRFPHASIRRCRAIVLVEAGPRMLPTFAPRLSAAAQRALERLGVEVRLGRPVTRCDELGVTAGEERVACGVTYLGRGRHGVASGAMARAEHDRAGRVLVESELTVARPSARFSSSAILLQCGMPPASPCPASRRSPSRKGKYVARVLRARMSGHTAPPAFRYRDYGELATVGRNFAVVDFHWLRLTGRIAWFVWSFAHIYFLIGFRNRLVVAMDWIWAYLTFQRGARLITASDSDEDPSSRTC